jgi:hypothetical protein
MNKKEQYAELAERSRGRPADVLDMHPRAKVLCEEQKDGKWPAESPDWRARPYAL